MEFKTWQATIKNLKERAHLGHALALTVSEERFDESIESLSNVLGIEKFDLKILSKKEGETKIKIEDVRKWVGGLQLSARGEQGTLGVIRRADLLTPESANALLKTIEEPTKNTFILLLMTRDNLIFTIRSRVSVFNIDYYEDPQNTVYVPDTVSGIIKLADNWQAKKVSQQKLLMLLHDFRTSMKVGKCSAHKADRILDAVNYGGSGLNQKLLVEGVLIDYDK